MNRSHSGVVLRDLAKCVPCRLPDYDELLIAALQAKGSGLLAAIVEPDTGFMFSHMPSQTSRDPVVRGNHPRHGSRALLSLV